MAGNPELRLDVGKSSTMQSACATWRPELNGSRNDLWHAFPECRASRKVRFSFGLHQSRKCYRPEQYSVWASQPGILPGGRDVLVVATEPSVGAAAVAELQRLAFSNWNGKRASEARVELLGQRVFDTLYSCCPTDPDVSIERGPRSEEH